MTEEKVEYRAGAGVVKHYSTRLKRNFKDGDWLNLVEAAQVISENSGREVKSRYLAEMVRRGHLHPDKSNPRGWLYKYDELKKEKVLPHVGRRKLDQPTENALRQRAFKARRRSVAE